MSQKEIISSHQIYVRTISPFSSKCWASYKKVVMYHKEETYSCCTGGLQPLCLCPYIFSPTYYVSMFGYKIKKYRQTSERSVERPLNLCSISIHEDGAFQRSVHVEFVPQPTGSFDFTHLSCPNLFHKTHQVHDIVEQTIRGTLICLAIGTHIRHQSTKIYTRFSITRLALFRLDIHIAKEGGNQPSVPLLLPN